MRVGRFNVNPIDAILAVLLPLIAIGLYIEFSDSVTSIDVIQAARAGDIAFVAEHLDDGFDFLAHDERSRTVLHAAAESGNEDMVRYVLANGCDIAVGEFDITGYTPAHLSLGVRTPFGPGARPTIQAFLEHGIDVNLKTRFREPLLVSAIEMRNVPIALMLLESGASIDAKNIEGRSLVEYLAYTSLWTLLERLLENDSNVNLRLENGSALPLAYAIQERNSSGVRLLLRHGADPNTMFSVQWAMRSSTGGRGDSAFIGPKPIGYEKMTIPGEMSRSERSRINRSLERRTQGSRSGSAGTRLDPIQVLSESREWFPHSKSNSLGNLVPSSTQITRLGTRPMGYLSLISPLDFALWHDRECARILLEHGAKGEGFTRLLVNAINH